MIVGDLSERSAVCFFSPYKTEPFSAMKNETRGRSEDPCGICVLCQLSYTYMTVPKFPLNNVETLFPVSLARSGEALGLDGGLHNYIGVLVSGPKLTPAAMAFERDHQII